MVRINLLTLNLKVILTFDINAMEHILTLVVKIGECYFIQSVMLATQEKEIHVLPIGYKASYVFLVLVQIMLLGTGVLWELRPLKYFLVTNILHTATGLELHLILLLRNIFFVGNVKTEKAFGFFSFQQGFFIFPITCCCDRLLICYNTQCL